MGFVTSSIRITPENVSEIPRMVSKIDSQCERLKICLFYNVNQEGQSSTLSSLDFQPVINKIRSLSALVKVVLDFDQRVYTTFQECAKQFSSQPDWKQGHMNAVLPKLQSATLRGYSCVDSDMTTLVSQFFNACQNVKSMSLKSFIFHRDLCNPLCDLIREGTKLAFLKISHRCNDGSNCSFSWRDGEQMDHVLPIFPLLGNHQVAQNWVDEDNELYQSSQAILQAVARTRSIELFGYFCSERATKPHVLNNFVSTNSTLKFEQIGERCGSKCLEHATRDLRNPTVELIENNQSIHHLFLNGSFTGLEDCDMHRENVVKMFKKNNTLLNFQTTESFWGHRSPLLGDTILIPEKHNTYIRIGERWSKPEIDARTIAYRARTKEFFYLVEYTEEKGQSLNKIDEMIRQGISVNAWDENFDTALHKAAGAGNLFMIQFLRKRKAFITHNKQLKTPIDLAREHENSAELLKALGVTEQAKSMMVSSKQAIDPQMLMHLHQRIAELEGQNAEQKRQLDQARETNGQLQASNSKLQSDYESVNLQKMQLERLKQSLADEVTRLRGEVDNLRGLS